MERARLHDQADRELRRAQRGIHRQSRRERRAVIEAARYGLEPAEALSEIRARTRPIPEAMLGQRFEDLDEDEDEDDEEGESEIDVIIEDSRVPDGEPPIRRWISKVVRSCTSWFTTPSRPASRHRSIREFAQEHEDAYFDAERRPAMRQIIITAPALNIAELMASLEEESARARETEEIPRVDEVAEGATTEDEGAEDATRDNDEENQGDRQEGHTNESDTRSDGSTQELDEEAPVPLEQVFSVRLRPRHTEERRRRRQPFAQTQQVADENEMPGQIQTGPGANEDVVQFINTITISSWNTKNRLLGEGHIGGG